MNTECLNAEFDDIIITFTNQNGRPLEIGDKFNLTLKKKMLKMLFMLFYAAKKKKICQRIRIFLILVKSIYWILP